MSMTAKSIIHSTHRHYESSNYVLPCDKAEQERSVVSVLFICVGFLDADVVCSVTVKVELAASDYYQGI